MYKYYVLWLVQNKLLTTYLLWFPLPWVSGFGRRELYKANTLLAQSNTPMTRSIIFWYVSLYSDVRALRNSSDSILRVMRPMEDFNLHAWCCLGLWSLQLCMNICLYSLSSLYMKGPSDRVWGVIFSEVRSALLSHVYVLGFVIIILSEDNCAFLLVFVCVCFRTFRPYYAS